MKNRVMDRPSPASASTPCVRICVVDPATGLCEGCGRTLAEIAAWGAMPEAERRRIMIELDARPRPAALPAALPAVPPAPDPAGA